MFILIIDFSFTVEHFPLIILLSVALLNRRSGTGGYADIPPIKSPTSPLNSKATNIELMFLSFARQIAFGMVSIILYISWVSLGLH